MDNRARNSMCDSCPFNGSDLLVDADDTQVARVRWSDADQERYHGVRTRDVTFRGRRIAGNAARLTRVGRPTVSPTNVSLKHDLVLRGIGRNAPKGRAEHRLTGALLAAEL